MGQSDLLFYPRPFGQIKAGHSRVHSQDVITLVSRLVAQHVNGQEPHRLDLGKTGIVIISLIGHHRLVFELQGGQIIAIILSR